MLQDGIHARRRFFQASQGSTHSGLAAAAVLFLGYSLRSAQGHLKLFGITKHGKFSSLSATHTSKVHLSIPTGMMRHPSLKFLIIYVLDPGLGICKGSRFVVLNLCMKH